MRLRKNWLSPFLSFRSYVHSIVPELVEGAIAGKTTAEPMGRKKTKISAESGNYCRFNRQCL